MSDEPHAQPLSPKRMLLARGLRPRKRFGQNFLVDAHFAAAVAAALPEHAFVVEIGAGTGSLTAALLRHARHLVAIEIDRDLGAMLADRFAGVSALEVIQGDALGFQLRAALRSQAPPRAICGNLPYYITTPLIEHALEAVDEWECAVFMVQREYAKRLVAPPGSAAYASLTVFVSYFCTVEKLFDIGAAGFYPAPDVASSVVRLTPRPRAARAAQDDKALLRVVRAAFAQRRKTLANCLAVAAPNHPRASIDAAIRAAGIDPSIRGERLALDDFARLASALAVAGISLL